MTAAFASTGVMPITLLWANAPPPASRPTSTLRCRGKLVDRARETWTLQVAEIEPIPADHESPAPRDPDRELGRRSAPPHGQSGGLQWLGDVGADGQDQDDQGYGRKTKPGIHSGVADGTDSTQKPPLFLPV